MTIIKINKMEDLLSYLLKSLIALATLIFTFNLTVYSQSDPIGIEIQWMPLTDDQAYLNDMLEVAEAYQVDGFQISHNLMHSVDELVYPDKERKNMIHTKIDPELLVNFTRQLQERGYEAHFWTHEVVGPPPAAVKDGKVIIDHPEMLPFTVQKYQQARDMLPMMNSVILTLFETEYKVFDDEEATTMSLPNTPTERTIALIDLMTKMSDKIDVPLAVRGGFSESDEVARRVDAEFIHMVKNTETDWHPFAPLNDYITDRTHQAPMWVEFDAGYEYELRGTVPYGEPEKVMERLKTSAAHGVRTFVVRLDRYGGQEKVSAIYTPWGELALSLFTEFKADTSVRVQQIIADWEKEHFPDAYELVQLSTEVTKTLLFPKKMWYGNHSRPPSYTYAKKHILPASGFGFAQESATNDNVASVEAKELLINSYRSHEPDSAWYHSIMTDLAIVEPKLEQIDQLLMKNQDYVEQHPIWIESIDRLKSWAEVLTLNQKIYFGIRLAQHHPGALLAEELRALNQQYEAALNQIRTDFTDVKGSHIGGLLWNTEKTVSEFAQQIDQLP